MDTALYFGMTRHDICKAVADTEGAKHNFTDKDFIWSNVYNDWAMKDDKDLRAWCEQTYGDPLD